MNSASESPEFHYYGGEKVREGDCVISGGKRGIVEKIIAPGTADSSAFACPCGGVLIREDWGGVSNYLVLGPPDGICWEDLEFICRAVE